SRRHQWSRCSLTDSDNAFESVTETISAHIISRGLCSPRGSQATIHSRRRPSIRATEGEHKSRAPTHALTDRLLEHKVEEVVSPDRVIPESATIATESKTS